MVLHKSGLTLMKSNIIYWLNAIPTLTYTMASDRTVYGENAIGDDARSYASCKEGERVMR